MSKPVRQLGRYELLKRIAKGGMGEIYLARMRGAAGFEKHCIIKTILPHLAEEEEFVTKFLDEGRIVVQLVHGNIVPVFDMGDEGGEYYIAMEYIPGRDLRELMKRVAVEGGAVPVDLALFIVSEVCKGLDYAHRKTDESGRSLGIVHRDVSPSNVLISREGEVKIIDFGIARAAGRLSKTVSGRIQGKFCYMSPEQASGKRLDARSDIFSTGVLLYELLTGFRPFEGDSDLESLDLVRRCEFDPPSTLQSDVPEEIDAIVARALAKDADDRHPSIDRLQIAMLQYLYSTGSSPTSHDLAQYLAKLFPEGLEREELRRSRDSSSPPPQKMSLDEALDFELARLSDGTDRDIDPLQTTAIGARTPSESRSGPSTVDARPRDVGPEDEESVTGPTEREPRPRTSKGWIVAVVLLLAVVSAGALVAMDEADTGRIEVHSEPAGARIVLDGVDVLGARTPHTLEVEPGKHTLRLEKAGYSPRELTVVVQRADETRTIAASDATLRPLEPEESVREITVVSTPPDAVLFADDAQIGTGSGAPLLLRSDESMRVEARRSGCRSVKHLVTFSHPTDELHISLECDGAPAGDAGSGAEELPRVEAPPREDDRSVRFTIASDPPGATIRVGGRELGTAPVPYEAPADRRVVVEARREGWETMRVRKRAGSIRGTLTLRMKRATEDGCLNVRLQYPATAEIAVDGTWLPGTHDYRLERHPLTAGSHRVRVRNRAISFDETYDVAVKAGRDCALVVVDER